MKIKSVAVSSLVLDPANARSHPEKNLEAIKGSLAKFGQQKPIVVGANGVVIAGNGTLEAARALGWESIQAVFTTLEGPEAVAFALADNRSSELAAWDREILGATLVSLREINFDLSSIGFDTSYLDNFYSESDLKAGDIDKEDEWRGMPEFQDDGPCFRKIVVNFDTAEDVGEFFSLIDQQASEKTKSIWFPKKGCSQEDLSWG